MAQRVSSIPNPGKSVKTGYLFIGGSAVLAMLTGIIFFNLAMGTINNAAKPAPTVPIVVARSFIPAGQVIAFDQLKTVNWPSNLVPEGDVFTQAGPLIGRVAKTDIQASEPVYRAKLAGELSTGGLKILIPKGLRGMTVAVNEVTGVGGFVKPGDRVDVVATFRNVGKGDSSVQKTQTILQDVMVLAAAQEMSSQESAHAIPNPTSDMAGMKTEGKADAAAQPSKTQNDIKEEAAKIVGSVTLALQPEQIEKLALADETARIRLVLRSEEDHSVAQVNGITNLQLTGGAAPAAAPSSPFPRRQRSYYTSSYASYAPPKLSVQGHVVEVIDGVSRSQMEF